MAAIDKTYISNYQDFDKIRNWAKGIKIPVGKYTIPLVNYMYYPDLTEEEWNEALKDHINSSIKHGFSKGKAIESFSMVLWNTDTFVDVWLIRNCPFDIVQERLKEQYGGGWSKTAFTDHNEDNLYEQIKAGTSIYDTYQRNGLGKKAKVKIDFYGHNIRDKKVRWRIEINPLFISYTGSKLFSDEEYSYWYSELFDGWYTDKELIPIDSNVCYKIGSFTKKNIVNLVKKWNLPKGTIVDFEGFCGRTLMCEYVCKVS